MPYSILALLAFLSSSSAEFPGYEGRRMAKDKEGGLYRIEVEGIETPWKVGIKVRIDLHTMFFFCLVIEEPFVSHITILALELLGRKGLCSIFGLLMSCNVADLGPGLDASLRLGAPPSWEMKLGRPRAGLVFFL